MAPIAYERCTLPTMEAVDVPKAITRFKSWDGPQPSNTYGGKALIDLDGAPHFAELAILRLMRADGWDGVWVDTYRNKYRTGYWNTAPVAALPVHPAGVLQRIGERRGKGRAGTWDVVLWRGNDLRFIEAKRAGRDQPRPQQLSWLAAALAEGHPLDRFLIVEWSLLT